MPDSLRVFYPLSTIDLVTQAKNHLSHSNSFAIGIKFSIGISPNFCQYTSRNFCNSSKKGIPYALRNNLTKNSLYCSAHVQIYLLILGLSESKTKVYLEQTEIGQLLEKWSKGTINPCLFTVLNLDFYQFNKLIHLFML